MGKKGWKKESEEGKGREGKGREGKGREEKRNVSEQKSNEMEAKEQTRAFPKAFRPSRKTPALATSLTPSLFRLTIEEAQNEVPLDTALFLKAGHDEGHDDHEREPRDKEQVRRHIF